MLYIFIGNPDFDSLNVVSDAFLVLTKETLLLRYCVVSLRTNQFDLVSRRDPIAGKKVRLDCWELS